MNYVGTQHMLQNMCYPMHWKEQDEKDVVQYSTIVFAGHYVEPLQLHLPVQFWAIIGYQSGKCAIFLSCSLVSEHIFGARKYCYIIVVGLTSLFQYQWQWRWHTTGYYVRKYVATYV